MMRGAVLPPGLRAGVMRIPPSKSHAHRVLIAEFLAGRTSSLSPDPADCDDIAATKRCLLALADRSADGSARVGLDVGESGTTRRLLGPLVAALGFKADWRMRGRLAARPQLEYETLAAGLHELPGDVSSQFVSGLLFALPVLDGDSEIRLTTPLASRGYVDMTLRVLADYGVEIETTANGFRVPGGLRFAAPTGGMSIEGDWSGAAFVFALRTLGNRVECSPADRATLVATSCQPDRVIGTLATEFASSGVRSLDVDAFPDLFPVLTVLAAARPVETRFTGLRRLRLKESDRVAAMVDVLARLGVECVVGENELLVRGASRPFRGGDFTSFADHRVAMSIACAATRAEAPVVVDDVVCAAKSFPTFFADFERLERI